MNISDLLTNEKYLKIPLVGNLYCNKRPTNNDKNIVLMLDNKNPYDKRAIKVISIRGNFSNLLINALTSKSLLKSTEK